MHFDLTTAPWQFRGSHPQHRTWLPAIVPGCVHLDLLRLGQIPEPYYADHEPTLRWIEDCDWEYGARFDAPAALLAEDTVELCADGLDTVATVTLNGRLIATCDNMFIAHRWPVKSALRPRGNVLTVRFTSAMEYIRKKRTEFTPPEEFNDPVGNCARIRKQPCQFGWDWGPRFVTAGIWRGLRLEGWSINRFVHLKIEQEHRTDGTVIVRATPELAHLDAAVEFEATLRLAGHTIAHTIGRKPKALDLCVATPELWWPSGQGAQPLYDLEVVARRHGAELGRIHRRIGLRTIALDRTKDAAGECFRFVINGRPVFAKGANWIPADSFVTRLGRADYARLLQAAAAAHMNCIRVWGGGIYEHEAFYDVCDELGLLVWQDFMFACTLYPGDAEFLRSVEQEATHQVRRLHHRASLALWCGNNEVAQLNHTALEKSAAFRKAYEALFHRVLPRAIEQDGAGTAYWPSSEWRADQPYRRSMAESERSGDTHFWDVWHARYPVKSYERWRFRFVSEFGMQSYSSPATNATFCPAGERNVFGPVMELHQKNRAGNQIILDYVSRRYRFPQSQDDLIWLSQLNQAYCMQVGVEHYRRLMPHCMGALYWQLNDCWPGASWSSIEYAGRWKALHFAARRFFAPALVSAHVPGDETATIGNYRATSVDEVHIYTAYDAPTPARGILHWEISRLDGRSLARGQRRVTLRPNESLLQTTLKLAKPMQRYGRENIYLRLSLEIGAATVSEQSVFLTPPRFLALPRPRTKVIVKALSPTQYRVRLTSAVFQHAFTLDSDGLECRFSDNWFDLHPSKAREIVLTFARPLSTSQLKQRLTWRSLADTYQ